MSDKFLQLKRSHRSLSTEKEIQIQHMTDAFFYSQKHTHMHPTFAYTQRQGPDLVVELLVTGIEGLQFFTNEFVQYAPVYQCLTQLSDLRPVVPRVTKCTLQRLVVNGQMEKRVNV